MKNLYYFISLLLYVFFFNSCAYKNQSRSPQRTLKVLTYNIHHANPPSRVNYIDLPAVAKVIIDSKADLVGLQEIDVNTLRSGKQINQAAELGKLTGMHYYFAKGIDFQGGDYGIAILSRFPIIKAEKLALPMKPDVGGEDRVMALATIELWNGKQFIFANTHLDLKPENRILQANAIVNYLDKMQLPVIFCGDLNTSPGSEAMKVFDSHFKRSSIENGFTFPQNNPDREIDFILYKPKERFKIISHKIISETYASDHLPLLVELELN